MLLFLLILAGSFGLAAIFNTTMIWAVWYAFVFVFLLCLGQLIWPLTSVAWRLRPVERPADTPFSLTGTVANRRWWQWQPQWQAQDHTGWHQSRCWANGQRRSVFRPNFPAGYIRVCGSQYAVRICSVC